MEGKYASIEDSPRVEDTDTNYLLTLNIIGCGGHRHQIGGDRSQIQFKQKPNNTTTLINKFIT